MIQIEQLYLEKKNQRILTNINLQIQSGEFIFFIGESGAGKSSLLDLLYGRKMYHEGSLKINGQELASLSLEKLQKYRSQVGVIFQDNRLIEEWTVFDNLAYEMTCRGLSTPVIREKISAWTDLLGLKDRLKHYPNQLSGGEQQRVNIIRALIIDPKLVIADEPTANLDEKNARKVFSILKQINQTGTTVLMSTHNPNFIEAANFRVVKFSKGEIVYDQVSTNYFR